MDLTSLMATPNAAPKGWMVTWAIVATIAVAATLL
jgi:hypothetical protein